MGNKPIQTIRSSAAYGLSIAIWGSTTEGQFNLKIQKSYKVKETQEWKTSEYLSPQDLAGLAQLIPLAIQYCDRVRAQTKREPIQQTKSLMDSLPPVQSQGGEEPPPFEDSDIPF